MMFLLFRNCIEKCRFSFAACIDTLSGVSEYLVAEYSISATAQNNTARLNLETSCGVSKIKFSSLSLCAFSKTHKPLLFLTQPFSSIRLHWPFKERFN